MNQGESYGFTEIARLQGCRQGNRPNAFQRGLAAAEIYSVLRNQILTLTLEPGASLDEVGVSNRFVVSRSPIGEALHQLISSGLVRRLPNRLTIVAPDDPSVRFKTG